MEADSRKGGREWKNECIDLVKERKQQENGFKFHIVLIIMWSLIILDTFWWAVICTYPIMCQHLGNEFRANFCDAKLDTTLFASNESERGWHVTLKLPRDVLDVFLRANTHTHTHKRANTTIRSKGLTRVFSSFLNPVSEKEESLKWKKLGWSGLL